MNKIREEFKEWLEALCSESVEAQVEELWDLIQTMEQHMHEYEELGVDVLAVREQVVHKCEGRGLYDAV